MFSALSTQCFTVVWWRQYDSETAECGFSDCWLETKQYNERHAESAWLCYLWEVLSGAVNNITSTVSNVSLTAWSLQCWLTEFRKISRSLPDYFLCVAFLHVARRTTTTVLDVELIDVLAALVGFYVEKFVTSDLVWLLQKSAVEHLTTFRQMEARDFGSVVTIDNLYSPRHGSNSKKTNKKKK